MAGTALVPWTPFGQQDWAAPKQFSGMVPPTATEVGKTVTQVGRNALKVGAGVAPIAAYAAIPEKQKTEGFSALNPVLGAAYGLTAPIREAISSIPLKVWNFGGEATKAVAPIAPVPPVAAKTYSPTITDAQSMQYAGEDGRNRNMALTTDSQTNLGLTKQPVPTSPTTPPPQTNTLEQIPLAPYTQAGSIAAMKQSPNSYSNLTSNSIRYDQTHAPGGMGMPTPDQVAQAQAIAAKEHEQAFGLQAQMKAAQENPDWIQGRRTQHLLAPQLAQQLHNQGQASAAEIAGRYGLAGHEVTAQSAENVGAAHNKTLESIYGGKDAAALAIAQAKAENAKEIQDLKNASKTANYMHVPMFKGGMPSDTLVLQNGVPLGTASNLAASVQTKPTRAQFLEKAAAANLGASPAELELAYKQKYGGM